MEYKGKRFLPRLIANHDFHTNSSDLMESVTMVAEISINIVVMLSKAPNVDFDMTE